MSAEYWNHNSAYHPWLVDIAAIHRGDVLDVGCGEGLLAERLAPVSRSVTAIDSDPASLGRGAARLASIRNTETQLADFCAYEPGRRRFDLITFVASIHHMDMGDALRKARRLLVPGGEIAIVGLAANKSIADWAWSASCVPVAVMSGWLHRETRNIGVPVAHPRESLAEIRELVARILPNASIRRGLYYRYLLRWRLATPVPSNFG
ncbi:MAG: class I SAM-dependent methyltransferase [Mycobacteriaceae bacterium]|nr:class I SAM-dependent methyltransferase [Mycobacteriaceae bacterium]